MLRQFLKLGLLLAGLKTLQYLFVEQTKSLPVPEYSIKAKLAGYNAATKSLFLSLKFETEEIALIPDLLLGSVVPIPEIVISNPRGDLLTSNIAHTQNNFILENPVSLTETFDIPIDSPVLKDILTQANKNLSNIIASLLMGNGNTISLGLPMIATINFKSVPVLSQFPIKTQFEI